MELGGKVTKALSSEIWYHATRLSSWHSICANGVLAEYNKDTSDSCDFGYGFYLMSTRDRAENYLLKLLDAGVVSHEESPIILGFSLSPLEFFQQDKYNTCLFPKYDYNFAAFVFDNRELNIGGTGQHSFDAIYGVMSDSYPTELMLRYKNGEMSREEVISEIANHGTSAKQLSLHNQEICDILRLQEAYTYVNGIRKELNINDYNDKREALCFS